MITTVIFDLFCTLLELKHDSKPYHQIVKQAPLAKRFKLLRESMLHPCDSLTDYSKLIGLPVPKDIATLEAELKMDIESAALFDDSMSALIKLKQSGIKIGLISNLATPYKKTVKTLGIERYFDAIIFSCDIGLVKPDPAIYKLALEQLDSSPAETIMIGDSYKSDVRGPENVGIGGIHLVRNSTHNRSSEINALSKVVLEVCK